MRPIEECHPKILTNHNIFKCPDRAIGLVHLVKTGYLNQPPNVMGKELVLYNPLCEVIPFSKGPTIYTDTPLDVLFQSVN
jgi:hypothetical protein